MHSHDKIMDTCDQAKQVPADSLRWLLEALHPPSCTLSFVGDSLIADTWAAAVAGALRLGYVMESCRFTAGRAAWQVMERGFCEAGTRGTQYDSQRDAHGIAHFYTSWATLRAPGSTETATPHRPHASSCPRLTLYYWEQMTTRGSWMVKSRFDPPSASLIWNMSSVVLLSGGMHGNTMGEMHRLWEASAWPFLELATAAAALTHRPHHSHDVLNHAHPMSVRVHLSERSERQASVRTGSGDRNSTAERYGHAMSPMPAGSATSASVSTSGPVKVPGMSTIAASASATTASADSASAAQASAAFAASADPASAAPAAPPAVHLLWLELPPQHYPRDDGSGAWSVMSVAKAESCVPNANASLANWRNEAFASWSLAKSLAKSKMLASAAVHAAGNAAGNTTGQGCEASSQSIPSSPEVVQGPFPPAWQTVPIFDVYATRHDLHGVQGSGWDCTHYCYTPWLYDPIWQLIARQLRSARTHQLSLCRGG